MGVLMAWMVAIGLQTVRDTKNENRAPLPSEFIASGAWFGALTLVDGFASPVGSFIAWGTLFALLIQAGSPAALVAGEGPLISTKNLTAYRRAYGAGAVPGQQPGGTSPQQR